MTTTTTTTTISNWMNTEHSPCKYMWNVSSMSTNGTAHKNEENESNTNVNKNKETMTTVMVASKNKRTVNAMLYQIKQYMVFRSIELHSAPPSTLYKSYNLQRESERVSGTVNNITVICQLPLWANLLIDFSDCNMFVILKWPRRLLFTWKTLFPRVCGREVSAFMCLWKFLFQIENGLACKMQPYRDEVCIVRGVVAVAILPLQQI